MGKRIRRRSTHMRCRSVRWSWQSKESARDGRACRGRYVTRMLTVTRRVNPNARLALVSVSPPRRPFPVAPILPASLPPTQWREEATPASAEAPPPTAVPPSAAHRHPIAVHIAAVAEAGPVIQEEPMDQHRLETTKEQRWRSDSRGRRWKMRSMRRWGLRGLVRARGGRVG